MADKKKILGIPIAGVVFLALATIGLAAWILSINSGHSEYTIMSSDTNPLVVTKTFDGGIIDTLADDVVSIDKWNFTNTDGVIGNVSVNITYSFTDVEDDCDSWNDCGVSYTLDGIPLVNSAFIDVSSGNHTVEQTISCKRFSCPQSFDAIVSLVRN